MGWTFESGTTKQDLIEKLTREWETETRRSRVIDQSLVGEHLWYVVEQTQKDTGHSKRFIGLSLLAYDNGCRGWGSKDMDESAGPAAVDCPLRFLDMAPEAASPFAKGWRERVRAHHGPRPDASSVVLNNVALGIEARICQRDDGRFAVTLKDTDADSTLPTVAIFDELDDAWAYARRISLDDAWASASRFGR
jgi:hypothetical protein